MKYFFRKTGDKSRVGFTYAETKTLFLLSVFLLFPPLISAPIFAKDKLVETQTSLSVSTQEHPILDADYNGGEELIMTERDTKTNEHRITFDLSIPLYSIYWNPSNNQYYHVKDGSDLTKTNGLTYKLDSKKAEESIFVPDIKDPYLQYAGYISSNQRLYIDKRDNQQYIKILIPIKDPIEVVPYLNKYGGILYEEQPNIHQERFPRSPRTGNLPLGGLPY